MEKQTQAAQACKQLETAMAVDPCTYKAERDYLMICHGCGAFHVVKAYFISSPMSIGFEYSDGSQLCVPAHKCSTCPSEAIRQAWNNGMSKEAYNRAAAVVGGKVQQ